MMPAEQDGLDQDREGARQGGNPSPFSPSPTDQDHRRAAPRISILRAPAATAEFGGRLIYYNGPREIATRPNFNQMACSHCALRRCGQRRGSPPHTAPGKARLRLANPTQASSPIGARVKGEGVCAVRLKLSRAAPSFASHETCSDPVRDRRPGRLCRPGTGLRWCRWWAGSGAGGDCAASWRDDIHARQSPPARSARRRKPQPGAIASTTSGATLGPNGQRILRGQ